jgi:hypothetical protein
VRTTSVGRDQFIAVQVVLCGHLGEALVRISRHHVLTRWLYRGQTYRRGVHRIAEENEIFKHENLYPQSFRFCR